MDDLAPMNSRLLLSQDQLAEPSQDALPDQAIHDGTVTAGEVASAWTLNADLVTLSACQTGLGRQSSGDGFVGFSQAMFLAGARSLLLSLWEVDDRATALLMARFYQSWLGKRHGLDHRLSKADALREAKEWLRGLTAEEVESELTQIARGKPRAKAAAPIAGHPFDHPHYWAGFILMGDPN
jgi:CHAT domain-containing protein